MHTLFKFIISAAQTHWKYPIILILLQVSGDKLTRWALFTLFEPKIRYLGYVWLCLVSDTHPLL